VRNATHGPAARCPLPSLPAGKTCSAGKGLERGPDRLAEVSYPWRAPIRGETPLPAPVLPAPRRAAALASQGSLRHSLMFAMYARRAAMTGLVRRRHAACVDGRARIGPPCMPSAFASTAGSTDSLVIEGRAPPLVHAAKAAAEASRTPGFPLSLARRQLPRSAVPDSTNAARRRAGR